MFKSKLKKSRAKLSSDDMRRRKREFILIVVIILVVALLTLVESRIIRFGADIPFSNTILMFILINSILRPMGFHEVDCCCERLFNLT